MSKQHPVVAVTGSCGACTTMVMTACEYIFRRLDISVVLILTRLMEESRSTTRLVA